MSRPIRTAVFPAAGLGTRVLPAARAVPKEMLAVVDRPVIQYVVDEAREAGIERFVFVTASKKRVIEDHFSPTPALEELLRERGQMSLIATMNRDLPPPDAVHFAVQSTPLGLGHAVLCARDLVGDEPFAVLLPDLILRGKPGCLSQLIETYGRVGGNVVGILEAHPDKLSQYGIADPGAPISQDAFHIRKVVEKPPPGTAPSNLRLGGRYILQPEIFAHLEKVTPGAGGEIQLTDGLDLLIGRQPLIGHRFNGRSFDCGSKEGFIAANVALALEDRCLAAIIRQEIEISGASADGKSSPNTGADAN